MYKLSEKGERIREMFSDIAPRYDFLNRLLSFGIDRRWRRIAVECTRWTEGGKILDVATGTGDVVRWAQRSGSVRPRSSAAGRPSSSRSRHQFRKRSRSVGAERIRRRLNRLERECVRSMRPA